MSDQGGFKDKLSNAVDSFGDKIGDAADKAGDFVDDKTGGKYSDQIDSGVEKGKDALDGLDGKNDDIPDSDRVSAPGQAGSASDVGPANDVGHDAQPGGSPRTEPTGPGGLGDVREPGGVSGHDDPGHPGASESSRGEGAFPSAQEEPGGHPGASESARGDAAFPSAEEQQGHPGASESSRGEGAFPSAQEEPGGHPGSPSEHGRPDVDIADGPQRHDSRE